MDISDKGLLPRVSLADYGSVEYVRSLGCKVISSADVLQQINAVYSERSFALQQKANEIALGIKDAAFKEIARLINEKGETDEYTIQQFISDRYHENGMNPSGNKSKKKFPFSVRSFFIIVCPPV